MSSTEEYPSADIIMDKMTSSSKMERDVGLATLMRLVKGINCDEGERKHLIKLIRAQVAISLSELGNKESVAQGHFTDKKLGCLSAALTLTGHTTNSPAATDSHIEEENKQFALQIKPNVVIIMWDQDVRVRLLAGEVFGQICRLLGPSVYMESKLMILELLEKEFQRNREIEGMVKSPETPIDPTGEVASSEYHASPQLGLSPATTPTNPNLALSEVLKEAASVLQSGSLGSPGQIDSNLGCAQLESSLKCLQFIAKGLEKQFGPLIDQHLLDLIFPALHHQNRFLREAGFFLCATFIESGIDLKSMGRRLAEEITFGLSDFCGQARIAAAVACRKFMLHMQPQDRQEFLPILLPKLCLCRYYMADTKFLLYSQETWKMIFATDGPQLVTTYIDDVVSYYIEATSSENHAIREAACMCLGELSRKIDKQFVTPYAVGLLEILKRCFHDDRWHVRDAACLASGTFFLNYAGECRAQMETMLPLFFENLQFPISTVRQGSSAAIANIIRAYGLDVLPKLLEKISEGLAGIEFQQPETCVNADLPIINPELKYSYPPGQGAFIPYARPSHPWELGDGCLYLIGDMSIIPECQNQIPKLVPQILKAVQYRSFSQHVVICETVCKILPLLVQAIGKRPFKEYLSQFFEPIFYSIECDNSMTSGSGRACLKELCLIYGPNIIRSRVELHDPRLAHYVDEAQKS